ncbi:NADH-dependent flavin oxidoreductase, putative [Candida maltosa Xu316]|uniref:NADH-dependent flavin oxidoreductase, putative n=1 Tax=Candida maltosa (strain Xu316) TaxID=1245528 RepID=M3JC52_CANMX|nr:NADH-dependent flavin oxidoreductase, putative [Candida maltosa Xu316]
MTSTPALFKPIQLSSQITLPHRIGVSPMSMGSSSTATQNQPTPFHLIHYGALALRNPGMIIFESTAVSPDSGMSSKDLGLWDDTQAQKLSEIVDFIHSETTPSVCCCIQLNHAGRRADPKGTNLVAPSSIPYEGDTIPRCLTIDEIHDIVTDYADAAERAVKVGHFDAIEIHAGNGCLIHQFLSRITNHREDIYGVSSRSRFLLDIIDEIRDERRGIRDVPILVKLPMSDNCTDEGWSIEDAIEVADMLIERGVRVIDVTSGGIVKDCQSRYLLNEDKSLPSQVPLAKVLKQHVGERCLVACSGGLDRDIERLNEFRCGISMDDCG